MSFARVLSLLTAIISILVCIIHKAPPYLRLECVSLSISCPISKSYGIINDDTLDSLHLKPLKHIMQQWIRDGHSTAAQLSVFINNKERLNIFAKDDRKYPRFDRNSLIPVFSIADNLAAMLMAIAIQNKWIQSLDDAVTDYWPQFPTQRLILPWNTWLAYHNEHSSIKYGVNYNTLAQYCNQQRIHIDIKRHHVTIKDVLRHEAGYGLLLSYMNTTVINTYHDIKSMIESTEYLIHLHETPRNYHVFTRDLILNQIFMEIEPKHRSMSDYYQQEIVPKLSSQNVQTDQEFVLLFADLKNIQKHINNHIIQPPIYWNLYHVVLPLYLGADEPLNDVFQKQLCPTLVMGETWCSNASLSNSDGWKNMQRSYAFSKTFLGDMRTEYMSMSLVSNAYSIAKTVSQVLFSGQVIDDDVLSDILSESVEELDMFLGYKTVFSKGGFALLSYNGVDWYGWPGFGGSVLYFAPKYKCAVSFIVTASNSQHYNLLDAPRHKTIINLVSLQLLHDNNDQ